MIREVLEAHGKLDILVNNAGITLDKTVRKMTVEDWDRVVQVNLSGAFYLSRAILQHMLDRGIRPHHQHLLDHRRGRQHRPGQLRRVEVRPVRPDHVPGAGDRPQGHHRQLGGAGLHLHRDGPGRPPRRRWPRSSPRSRSAASASPTRSPASWSSSPTPTPGSSPARSTRSTAASTCSEHGSGLRQRRSRRRPRSGMRMSPPANATVEGSGELAVSVADQEFEPVGVVAEVHEQVAGLLGDPGPGRVGGDAVWVPRTVSWPLISAFEVGRPHGHGDSPRSMIVRCGPPTCQSAARPRADEGCPTLRCSGPCRYASNPLLDLPGPEEDDVSGVSPEDLAETDLIRELEHLHRTRHDTFLHGAPDALWEHTSRSAELEERRCLRRHPERDVDPARTRAGARGSDASFSP